MPTLASDLPPDLQLTLEDVRRRHTLQILDYCGGHRTHAAKLLGIDRKTLLRSLRRWRAD
jgi:transcriptional regulator of acetoin/glycerol metabolism